MASSNDALYERKLGDFVLRELIGEGGFAAVYRCEQPLLGREAVIKVLHQRLRASEEVVQRFMREARLASRIDHPYAAHIYAFGVEPEDGLVWIAMEFVHGTSLEHWLRDRGPLALDQLVPFFENVAEVVQNAHDHGIVHRDLKPSNVMMIERAGRILPKLLDFGIAKLVDDAAQIEIPAPPAVAVGSGAMIQLVENNSNLSLTQANATLGSPPYMSPEQWTDPLSVGPRSDLYSLAIMAYEALTGKQPFEAPSIAEIGYLHCSAPIPPIGDRFPAALDAVFQRALAKLSTDRPASAIDFARELRIGVYGTERFSTTTLDGIPVSYNLSGSHPVLLPSTGVHITPVPGTHTTPVPGTHTTPVPGTSPLAAVSLTDPPAAKRQLWPFAAGAAALLAGGVAAYMMITSGSSDAKPVAPPPPQVAAPEPRPTPAPPPAPAVAPAPATPPAPAMVKVEIVSTPVGAEVFRLPSETKVGATPWKAEVPSEPGTQVFLVKKAGYADRRVEIDLRTGGAKTVTLPRAKGRPTSPTQPAGQVRRKGEPVDPFRKQGAR
jgi:serine/threonine-protein kinase